MKYLKEIEVSEGVIFKKINTARWVVAYHNEDEEYNVHFDQKISRKFEDIILNSNLEDKPFSFENFEKDFFEDYSKNDVFSFIDYLLKTKYLFPKSMYLLFLNIHQTI